MENAQHRLNDGGELPPDTQKTQLLSWRHFISAALPYGLNF
jgi:hypothetical protein